MRVLHFYKTSLVDTLGGVEVFMDTLCNATAEIGVENIILCLSNDPAPEPIIKKNYKIIQVKQNLYLASTGFSWAAFSKFYELTNNVDIIHYHFPNPFADILHFVCKINKPTVLTYHSDIIKQKLLLLAYRPLMHKFLATMDTIIATSPNYFATSANLKRYQSKVKIIPIGLDKHNLPALDAARVKYWQQRLPKRFFLFIGVMRYYKGLHIVLEALRNTNFQFVLGGVGNMVHKLKTLAKKYKLNNVHFLGSITEEDKVAIHHLSDAFIFPSNFRSEAFGISLIEAAALGKPLISCEIGTGTSFINKDQETGIVINPSSVIELIAAMRFLFDNPDKAAEFGMNAKKRFDQLFTAEKQAKNYLAVYQQVLGKSH